MAGNVIAPNDKKEPGKLAALVAKWDYRKAVERIAPKIERWYGVTADIVRELYLAREHLNGQQGQRKDPDAPDYIWHTWDEFCAAVGISRQTANGFLRRFVPAEISESGEDKLFSPEEWKAIAAPEAPLATREEERLIALFMNTGKRAAGWNPRLERIARERHSEKKAKEVAELWLGRLPRGSRRDYFADFRTMAGKNKRFRLKTTAQMNAQNVMFRTIHEYFELFESSDDLMAASANLTDKVRYAANYFAELLVDAAAAEEAGE
jgi:hypothetical protein